MSEKKIKKRELSDEDLEKVIGGPDGEGDGTPPEGNPPRFP